MVALFSIFAMVRGGITEKVVGEMPIFGILRKIDTTAVDNALAGMTKEIVVRYDLKHNHCQILRTKEAIQGENVLALAREGILCCQQGR